MAIKNYFERNHWQGSHAERLTVIPAEDAYWIEEDTGELWGFYLGAWHCLSGAGGPGGVTEGPGIDIVAGVQVGLGGDTVLLYDSAWNPVAEFTTVTLALAAATSGDVVVMPAGIFTEDVSIPVGVSLTSTGNNSKIVGAVTLLGHNSQLKSVVVELIGNSAGALIGVSGPPAGTGLVNDCSISVINNGAGDAYATQVNDGDLLSRNTWLETTTNGGGNAYGMYGAAGGNGYSNNSLAHATVTAGGVGHDYYIDGAGSIWVTDGSAEATTAPVGV
jgi:hypothetical protein